MISKFGQRVELTITDKAGNVVLETDQSKDYGIGLRVDFDLHMIYGYSRGTIKVYNLNAQMIKEINNGERYVTLRAKLHDVDDFVLVDTWYISNSLEEKKVPNSVLSLYCYDTLRKDLLEKSVRITIKQPSLANVVKRVVESAGFDSNKVEFKHFPPTLVNIVPNRPSYTWNGSVQGCMDKYSVSHDFDYYTQNNKLILMHRPTIDTVLDTVLHTQPPEIILDSNNMRANPKLAPAQLLVTSNLDGNIEPTSVLDISQLVTYATNADEVALQIGDEFLNKSTIGYNKYQTITVQHRGSNYINLWETIVTASAPSKGTTMPFGSFNASRI